MKPVASVTYAVFNGHPPAQTPKNPPAGKEPAKPGKKVRYHGWLESPDRGAESAGPSPLAASPRKKATVAPSSPVRSGFCSRPKSSPRQRAMVQKTRMHLQRSAVDRPHSFAAQRDYGTYLLSRGEPRAALAFLWAAEALEPVDQLVHAALAAALSRLGQADAAQAHGDIAHRLFRAEADGRLPEAQQTERARYAAGQAWIATLACAATT